MNFLMPDLAVNKVEEMQNKLRRSSEFQLKWIEFTHLLLNGVINCLKISFMNIRCKSILILSIYQLKCKF